MLGVRGKWLSWTPPSAVDVHSDVHRECPRREFQKFLAPKSQGSQGRRSRGAGMPAPAFTARDLLADHNLGWPAGYRPA